MPNKKPKGPIDLLHKAALDSLMERDGGVIGFTHQFRIG